METAVNRCYYKKVFCDLFVDDFGKSQDAQNEKNKSQAFEKSIHEKDNKITYDESASCDNSVVEKNDINNEIDQLTISDVDNEILTSESLKRELASVALDWKTLRNVEECSCTTPFDHSTRKVKIMSCSVKFCMVL